MSTCVRPSVYLSIACLLFALLSGCAGTTHRTEEPMSLRAPYDTPSAVVWAVVPVANESGTSAVNELALTDRIIQAIREVRGLSALSTNRVINGLDALELDTVRTPGEALILAELLGVDAVVIPTLTGWDPYDPPRIGLDVDVYARSGTMGTPDDPMSPFELTRATSDQAPDEWDPRRPVAAISIELDGSNGAVRSAVRAYADGRADPVSAAGWRGYLRSMERFESFASFQTVQALMQSEAIRVGVDPYTVTMVRERRWPWD